jgi:hypothetical protein
LEGKAMQVKTSRILGKIIVLSLITATTTYAYNEKNLCNPDEKSYKAMSTAQLQQEVEQRSINGDLCFDMGMELIKRWTNG